MIGNWASDLAIAAYSVEELVAELTAAFTLAHLGLSSEPREDHAQYIASLAAGSEG